MAASLPIDEVLGEVVAAVRTTGAAVVLAPPGAGKTTRVPAALLAAGLGNGRDIVVLQPRRLATRLVAARVAEERGEPLGQSVGYRVRFETRGGEQTRLWFVTEGVLTRMLAADPELDAVGLVVLDELHERHLHGDVALAACQRLRLGPRPDLGLVAMSATLDAAPVAARLGGAPVVRTEGRCFDVEISYLDRPDTRPLEIGVASALERLLLGGLDGHVLAFLPGAAEIRRAWAACEPVAERAGLEIVGLHGQLPAAEQDRAVRPTAHRRLVLATNVAETSVTIEGVDAVIDSGLARHATYAAWSGLPSSRVGAVSKASAAQRAGRAGRTRPGRCARLYTESDFLRRAASERPEIERADLAEALLGLLAQGIREPAELPWLDPPPPRALGAAHELLGRLGAVGADGALSPLGRALVRWPLHPRLARILLEAQRCGASSRACTAVALLSERELDVGRRARLRAASTPSPSLERSDWPADSAGDDAPGPSDLERGAAQLELARELGFDARALRVAGIDKGAALAVEATRRALERMCSPGPRGRVPPGSPAADDDAALRRCLLAGFPDRVAKRVRERQLTLSNGGSAELASASVAWQHGLLCALDAEERQGPTGRNVLVRKAVAVEADWLLELQPTRVRTSATLEWNDRLGRVELCERLHYDSLVIDESVQEAAPSEEAARLLARAVRARGAGELLGGEGFDSWLARLALCRELAPDAALPPSDEAALDEAIELACAGCRSLAELRGAGLRTLLDRRLGREGRLLLDQLAPESLELPSGRRLRIRYERGRPPWVESRLQDFFGMTKGPRVGAGRIPLVLHLLAPNGRPVQITSDLESFWEDTYATVRTELSRRYPKHAWPADGRAAKPPAPPSVRRRAKKGR